MLKHRITIISLLIFSLICVVAVEATMLDTDGDGIYDDGDLSGVVGDNPCTGVETTNCDDNCVDVYNPSQSDSDGDGIGNACEDNAIDFGREPRSRIEVENDGLPNVANTEFTVEAWVKGSQYRRRNILISYPKQQSDRDAG